MSTPTATPDRLAELASQQQELIAELRRGRDSGAYTAKGLFASAAAKGARATTPWESAGHFFKSVMQSSVPGGTADEKMKAWVQQSNNLLKTLPAGYNETVGADGGYLVPPEYANRILMRVYDNPLLGMITMLPLGSGNSLRVPYADETSRADGSQYGGISSGWEGEEESTSESKGKLGMIDLRLKRLSAAAKVTDEMITDAPGAMESYLNIVVPSVLTFRIGKALVRGTGGKQPEGMLNSPSKITVSAEAGQAANSLLARNVNKMWARLFPQCEENAVWLIDKSTYPALDEMTIGNASAQMAVYLPPGGLSAQRYATIKGRPAIPVEFCSQLGTEGDIILVDPTTLIGIMKSGIQTAVSMHVYFLAHAQSFRFTLRMDAQSWWRSPLTPASAGDTQGNIITVATRP